jgi:acetylcholinesterase
MLLLDAFSTGFESIAPSLQLHLDAMSPFNMVQRVLSAFTVLTSLASATATHSGHEVTLPGYGSFIGTTINQTLTKKSLPVTVDAWLGIEYASQPVGQARFAPVGPPAQFSGTKNASQYGFSCHQDPLDISYEMNEACLSMNVYRPQNVSSHARLPVLIWIHGVSITTAREVNLLIAQGGFVAGSARSFDGASFVSNSREPLIVVSFDYRVSELVD